MPETKRTEGYRSATEQRGSAPAAKVEQAEASATDEGRGRLVPVDLGTGHAACTQETVAERGDRITSFLMRFASLCIHF